MTNRTHSATIAVLASTIYTMGCNSEPGSSSSSSEGTSSSSVTSSVTGSSSASGAGGGSAGGAGGADAGGTGSGGADAGADCSPIVNTATEIEEAYLNEAQPTATGGTITDGTYELVSRVIYTGAAGMTGPTGGKFKETIQIQNVGPGTLRFNVAITINGGPEQYPVLLATVKGNHFDAVPICGTISLSADFDATPTSLKTYVTLNGMPLGVTFKKK